MLAFLIMLTFAALGPILSITIYHFRRKTGAGAISLATQIGMVCHCLMVLGAVYFLNTSGCSGTRETGITCPDLSERLGAFLFAMSIWIKRTGFFVLPAMFVVYAVTYFYHQGTKDEDPDLG